MVHQILASLQQKTAHNSPRCELRLYSASYGKTRASSSPCSAANMEAVQLPFHSCSVVAEQLYLRPIKMYMTEYSSCISSCIESKDEAEQFKYLTLPVHRTELHGFHPQEIEQWLHSEGIHLVADCKNITKQLLKSGSM